MKVKEIQEYDIFIKKIRNYFETRGFIEAPETIHTITSVCEENPNDVVLCKKNGMVTGLPQSNLKWIQNLLHQHNFGRGGVFMMGTSYNRGTMDNKKIYPILDFAAYGTFEDYIELLTDFCKYMELGTPIYINPTGINILKESECDRYHDKECVITTGLDKMFNKYYWYYKLVDNQYKIANVLLHGKRVISGGERNTDINKMMYDIYTLDNGEYIETLYNLFNKKRVDDELIKYTHVKLVTRFGATINLEALFNK